MRLLLVEDDDNLRAVMRTYFQKREPGLRVDESRTVFGALEHLEAREYEGAVLDWRLLNGKASRILEYMKGHGRRAYVSVFSGWTGEIDRNGLEGITFYQKGGREAMEDMVRNTLAGMRVVKAAKLCRMAADLLSQPRGGERDGDGV